MDEEETQESDAGSEIEKVQWRKKAKKESSTKQQKSKENSLEPNVQIVDNDQSRICLIITNKEE